MTPRLVLIDACVLTPTILREVVLGAAAESLFKPLWSDRILEEWARAAKRLDGEAGEMAARGDIALMRARWPEAEVTEWEPFARDLSLPDPDDAHVLAAAIAGRADALLTLNIRDFPRRALAAHEIERIAPDPFLWALWADGEPELTRVLNRIRAGTRAATREPQDFRRLLKRAGLPRLAKLWATAAEAERPD
jgi:predicted nucleic acid-binding protein